MSVMVEKKDLVTTIILNRPEVRNAVDGPTAAELARAFLEFDSDEDAAVAVFWGAGGCFCAGADLSAVARPEEGRLHRISHEGEGPLGPSRMRLSKPVIAAVAGHAVAGGLELAIWCDLRVVEETAVFGVFCRRFGVPLMDGGTIRLPRLIGMSRAMDMILTGRPVEAEEALAFGLANRVVPHGTAREEAERLAEQIARFPQMCMRSDRLSAYEQWNLSMEDALLNEFERGVTVLQGGETLQGARRFAEGKGRHGSQSDF